MGVRLKTLDLADMLLGGLKIEGEDESYDFGSGAGFYIDATKDPWSKGYKMYSYITEELPKALFSEFKELDESRVGIFGHSMGGHGALTLVRTCLTFASELTSSVLEKPWQIQISISICTDRKPKSMPLG